MYMRIHDQTPHSHSRHWRAVFPTLSQTWPDSAVDADETCRRSLGVNRADEKERSLLQGHMFVRVWTHAQTSHVRATFSHGSLGALCSLSFSRPT